MVRCRLAGTEATGKIACPEYPVLGGSGTVIDVAPAEVVGEVSLVVAKAALTGNCGAPGVTGTDPPEELALPQPASNTVASAIAPVTFNRRIR